jgi:hypothetical protein
MQNFQAIFQSRNGSNPNIRNGWQDYCREPVAASAEAWATNQLPILRRQLGTIEGRVSVEDWGNRD